jgi:hypothetical protein
VLHFLYYDEYIYKVHVYILQHGGDGVCRFELRSHLKTEDVSPQVSFKSLTQPLRPTESKIRCLTGARDLLPEGRQIYALELTYGFHVVGVTYVTLDILYVLVKFSSG